MHFLCWQVTPLVNNQLAGGELEPGEGDGGWPGAPRMIRPQGVTVVSWKSEARLPARPLQLLLSNAAGEWATGAPLCP